MKFEIREKVALFIGILFVTIVLWYMFLFSPKNMELEKISDQQKKIEMQYNQLSNNFSLAMLGSAEKLRISRKCVDILDNLPSKKDIASALSRIIEIGQGKDIRIVSINPHQHSFSTNQTQEKESQLEKIPLDITLEGKFLNISEFLFDLIDLPYLAGYSKIEIESSKETYPETKAQVTCILLFLKIVT